MHSTLGGLLIEGVVVKNALQFYFMAMFMPLIRHTSTDRESLGQVFSSMPVGEPLGEREHPRKALPYWLSPSLPVAN